MNREARWGGLQELLFCIFSYFTIKYVFLFIPRDELMEKIIELNPNGSMGLVLLYTLYRFK